MIVSGLFLLIFGGRLSSFTLWFSTTVFSSVFFCVILHEYFLPSWTPVWTVWLTYYITGGMGAALGIGAIHWDKISTPLIGACYGAMTGI